MAGLVALGLLGCRSGDPPGRESARGTAAARQPEAPAPTSRARSHDKETEELDWGGSVEWATYEEGLARARAESKPMMVVVYAEWCPKCRALAPVFARPDVAELTKKLVMVRQDHDEDPAWLKPYNDKYGGYVPRIFFFDSNGKVREDVTSGHPRYPFFYAAGHIEFLKRSMRTAIGS